MDSIKALAILAFCAGAHAAALPQIPALGAGTATTAGKNSSHNSWACGTYIVAAVGPATASAAAGVAGLPVAVPAVPGLALPAPVPGKF
jgi:hypothetical protein